MKMKIIDISDDTAINSAFDEMAFDGSHDNQEFKIFGEIFYPRLTENNKKLYQWAYPPRHAQIDESASRSESMIFSRQERIEI